VRRLFNIAISRVEGPRHRAAWISGVCRALTLLVVAGATTFVSASAQAQSVAEIFAKLDLFGTWSVDCSRPASRENPHYVAPPQTGGPVQRQNDGGPAGSTSTTIDVAHELGPGELLVSLFDGGDQSRRVKAIWRLERNRLRVWLLVANDGRVRIAAGKIAGSDRDAPWINKCS
jgi:hypothetical protein